MSSSLTDGESHELVNFNSRPALAKDYHASAGAAGTDGGSSVVKLSLVLVGVRLFRTIVNYTGLDTTGGWFWQLNYSFDLSVGYDKTMFRLGYYQGD